MTTATETIIRQSGAWLYCQESQRYEAAGKNWEATQSLKCAAAQAKFNGHPEAHDLLMQLAAAMEAAGSG